MTSPHLLDTYYGYPWTGRLSCSLITDSGNTRIQMGERGKTTKQLYKHRLVPSLLCLIKDVSVLRNVVIKGCSMISVHWGQRSQNVNTNTLWRKRSVFIVSLFHQIPHCFHKGCALRCKCAYTPISRLSDSDRVHLPKVFYARTTSEPATRSWAAETHCCTWVVKTSPCCLIPQVPPEHTAEKG